MDFSLIFQPADAALPAAVQKKQILAVSSESFSEYGLRLTADEAEMLVQTEKKAVSNAGLVQFGAGITPKLIHWFLPSGYLQYIPLCIAGGSDFDGDRDRSGDSSESEDQVPVFLPDGLLPADGYFIAGSRSCLEIHV